MKKAIYLLLLASSATLFIALADQKQEVEGLKKQTTEYEQLLQDKDGKIKELEQIIGSNNAELKDYGEKVNELVQVIEDKNIKIFDLRDHIENEKKNTKPIVFNPEDVSIPSNLSVEQLQKALCGTALETLASTYIELEEEKGINAIFLAALTAWESGWGRSDFAVNKNNVGGVKNPNANGYRCFASKDACVEYIANFLSMSYLDPNGKHYNGKSISGISIKYNFGEEEWINGITSVAYKIASSAKE